jgi:hypothetical protein
MNSPPSDFSIKAVAWNRAVTHFRRRDRGSPGARAPQVLVVQRLRCPVIDVGQEEPVQDPRSLWVTVEASRSNAVPFLDGRNPPKQEVAEFGAADDPAANSASELSQPNIVAASAKNAAGSVLSMSGAQARSRSAKVLTVGGTSSVRSAFERSMVARSVRSTTVASSIGPSPFRTMPCESKPRSSSRAAALVTATSRSRREPQGKTPTLRNGLTSHARASTRSSEAGCHVAAGIPLSHIAICAAS